jgi:S-adenosylmethionine hydrolase
MVPDLFSNPRVELMFPDKGITITERRRYFSENADGSEDKQRPFIYGDSTGYVGVAVRDGNAARTLGICYGASVTFILGLD